MTDDQRRNRIRKLRIEAMAHDAKSREYRMAGSPALCDFAEMHEGRYAECKQEADRLSALLPENQKVIDQEA